MGCMKCGRDIIEGQTFCSDCLAAMEKYPVKPNTPVNLPVRHAEVHKRTPVRRKLSPEEQIRRLRRLNRILSFLLALSLMLSIFFGYIAVLHLLEEEKRLPGQNYTSIETAPTDVSRETGSP